MIFQHHAVVLAFTDGDRFQPEILADAVFGMNHQIAAAQRLQFGQEGVGIFLAFLAPDQPVAQNILLCQQFQFGICETAIQRQDHGGGLSLGCKAERFLPIIGQRGFRPCLVKNGCNPRAASFGICGEQGFLARFRNGLKMLRRRVIDIVAARAFGGEVACGTEPEIDDLVALGLGKDHRTVDWPALQAAFEFLASNVQRLFG